MCSSIQLDMPGRNIEKIYLADTYYHLYNRGINKGAIFPVKQDYAVFLNLLKRYLDTKPVKDNKGREYEWLHKKIELLAFCLMPTHYHLLVYQHKPECITSLIRAVAGAYTIYFNKKYNRRGPLFESRFRATVINRDEYLEHISRYIHLNPSNYRGWEYSSLPYYLKKRQAGWVQPKRIMGLFRNEDEYMEFLGDYREYKRSLELIKSELADS